MREIKFRAWDTVAKQMRDWEAVKCVSLGTLSRHAENFVQSGEPAIVMQYTGLKDKNGKEIYEGDIVNSEGNIGEVIFGEYECDTGHDQRNSRHTDTFTFIGWHLKTRPRLDGETIVIISSWDKNDNSKTISKWSEIIGNIYENPELLKRNC